MDKWHANCHLHIPKFQLAKYIKLSIEWGSVFLCMIFISKKQRSASSLHEAEVANFRVHFYVELGEILLSCDALMIRLGIRQMGRERTRKSWAMVDLLREVCLPAQDTRTTGRKDMRTAFSFVGVSCIQLLKKLSTDLGFWNSEMKPSSFHQYLMLIPNRTKRQNFLPHPQLTWKFN